MGTRHSYDTSRIESYSGNIKTMPRQATTGYPVTQAFTALIVALMVTLATASYFGGAHAQQQGDGASSEDGSAAQGFDTGFTERTVADGEAKINACAPLEPEQRINCVSEALRSISRRLANSADYHPVARVFRDTAVKVAATKVVRVALEVLTVAKKNVLRAYGDKHHLARLGTLMDTAKSVLRS